MYQWSSPAPRDQAHPLLYGTFRRNKEEGRSFAHRVVSYHNRGRYAIEMAKNPILENCVQNDWES